MSQNFTLGNISGFVLAGGRSSRLGQDKVLLPWRGHTLLQHSIERLQQVCGTVQVCGDRNDHGQSLLLGDPWIRDAVPGAGPLGGIVAALESSPSAWNFLLAVDLPLLPVALLRALAERPLQSAAGTVCILPQLAGQPQPLCGLYHRALAPGLRRALAEGKYKIMLAVRAALAAIASSHLEFFDIETFIAHPSNGSPLQPTDWFLNINTPQDWLHARQLTGQQALPDIPQSDQM